MAEGAATAGGSARSATRSWRVRTPASTSNLGPGFDLAGLALDLFLEVELRWAAPGEAARVVLAQGEARAWPAGHGNKLLMAFEHTLQRLGGDPAGAQLSARSDIPVARGLGSSGAAIVAGVELACAAAGASLSLEERLALAMLFEGHPDNVTPALLGGCTLSMPLADGPPAVLRQPLHPSLAFAVAWPAAELDTAQARALLPDKVSFADAAENPRRLALLLEGLRSGDARLISAGAEDRLHARYRLPRIPGGEAALLAARDAGAWMATISGSGTGLFAISSHERAPAVAAAMRDRLERASPPAGGRVARVVDQPAQVAAID